MTPQEKELITQLLTRLKQAGGQTKDPEADALIRGAVAEQPDAPYYLVQTVLIQDMALANAQNRIAELERQVAAGQPQQQQQTSFLGGLLNRGGSGAQPGAGPWGGRPAQPQPAQPAAGPAAGPWGQPAGAAPMMQGGGGFLRQAAATAAGIAGGALLFQGIQSLFGHSAGGILSQAGMQPGLSETVINNYYGEEAASGGQDYQNAAWESGDAGGGDWSQDPGTDSTAADDPAAGQDFASDADFGSDDDLV